MSHEIPQSIYPLALLAAREAGADGFAIYGVAPDGLREPRLSSGAFGPETVSFPLSGTEAGELAFSFRRPVISSEARSILDQMAAVIEEIWRLSSRSAAYTQRAVRIAELETALADSKIADRARGLLASANPQDAVDTILRHVRSVLRPSPFETVLNDLSEEVEREIAERELASRAKAVLQTRYGMSEDQAHVHLRLVSRQSRRRLPDVARELLRENRPSA